MTADWPGTDEPGRSEPRSSDTVVIDRQEPARPAARRVVLPALVVACLAGLVWWVVGFLGWILTGLGHDVVPQDDLPVVAVPLVTGNVGGLVVAAGVGGVAAGLVALLGRDRRRSAVAAVAGVSVVMVSLLVQSRTQIGGSRARLYAADDRVLDGLTALVVVVTVVALAIGLLALTGRVGLGIALAVIAGGLANWLFLALDAVVTFDQGNIRALDRLTTWSGVAMLAVALVVIGVRPVARLVWWVVAVLLAWIISPVVTAATYVEPLLRPGTGLPGTLGDDVSASLRVLGRSASPDNRSVTSWIVAIAVAAVVAVVVDRVRPARDGTDHTAA